MKRSFAGWLLFALVVICAGALWAGDQIPKAAWKRGIGEPLAHAGGRKPSLNPAEIVDDGYWQGAPVGGFGAGTFSRTYRGDFSRWHIKAGVNKYETILANQFSIYQKSEGDARGLAQVLTAAHPGDKTLSSWKWDYPVGAGDYYALYPKSWYDYRWEKFPAHLVLEQFSPILPGNYKETSYPVAVYRWHAENPTSRPVTVSILLTWANMIGWFRDFSPNLGQQLNFGNFNRFVSARAGSAGTMKGIVFDRNRKTPVQDEWDGQFAIATLEQPGVEVSYEQTFRIAADGRSVWEPFSASGKLSNDHQDWYSSDEPLGAALAVTFTLKPGEKRVVPMVIAWDLPIVEFGSGRKWLRHYTDFYSASGANAWKIAQDGLTNASAWSDAIDKWQAEYVNDESKPLWYRGMLFNELYILADGGTVWGRPLNSEPRTPHSFAFLECFDYPFYGTLDVRFYGSMPLVKFWPEIDKQVLREFAAAVPQSIPDRTIWRWKTEHSDQLAFRIRKVKGAVPHDLGVPKEDPFFQVNQFNWQNTSDWKDLNSKFVLMIWRDFVLTGSNDTKFLETTWPAVDEAMRHLRQYDRNGDGLPENDGFPDQTYDEWIVTGESAYCGGLYLGALRAAEEIARRLGHAQSAGEYHNLFVRAQKSYIDKLWTGEYFRYDVGSEYRDNIQADQLAGQWYANLTGLGDLVPPAMRVAALRKIFDFNVMKFAGGTMGAANGMGADGSIIKTNAQVQEVWTGTTFGLASEMLAEGSRDEAFKTAWGVYNITYDKKGYWFRTPEAWDIEGYYRASMYMRPAAIWAMEMVKSPAK